MSLKKTTEQIQISTTVNSTTPGAFAATPIDLQLNPLDNEVFVVEAMVTDFVSAFFPVLVADGSFAVEDRIAVTTTRPSAMPTIGNSNCLGTSYRNFNYAVQGGALTTITAMEQHSMDNPSSNLDRLGLIATSDFFISVLSDAASGSEFAVRLYGYRARADAATYAALVQSEVLSN